jgi:hypothetical protein
MTAAPAPVLPAEARSESVRLNPLRAGKSQDVPGPGNLGEKSPLEQQLISQQRAGGW